MQVIRDFLNKYHIADNTFAIGVSGGADSLALALMFKEEYPDYRIIALTVDHRLRPSSQDEAKYVAEIMKQHQIEHHILVWKGKKPQTGIEEQARIARYNLLCDWCKNNGIANLVIAHHLHDQAETFLMRLQRGSGLYGLSAMDSISERQGIKLLRPVLNISPNTFKEYLNQRDIRWVEDESNKCTDFLRVKMRNFLSTLEEETSISPLRIAEATADLRRVRNFIEDTVKQKISEKVHNWYNCGYSVDYAEFLSWHKELCFYILGELLTSLNQQVYYPEANSLTLLVDQLFDKSFSSATLGNCYILKDELKLWIIKENRGKQKNYSAADWDNFEQTHPDIRGLKIPHKLKEALLFEKI